MSLYNASTFWLVSNGANKLIVFDGKNLSARKLIQLHLINELFISSSFFNDVDRTVPGTRLQCADFGFSDNLGSVTIANNRLHTNICENVLHFTPNIFSLCIAHTVNDNILHRFFLNRNIPDNSLYPLRCKLQTPQSNFLKQLTHNFSSLSPLWSKV